MESLPRTYKKKQEKEKGKKENGTNVEQSQKKLTGVCSEKGKGEGGSE